MTRPAGVAGPILGALAAVARQDPSRAALIDHGQPVGYAALDRMAEQMAGWLWREGVAPGDLLGLTLRDDVAHLVVALALMRLGCDQVTLASHDPAALRSDIAARLGAAGVIGEQAKDALPGLPLLRPDLAAIAADPGPAPPPGLRPGRAARIILSSSGTTGRPKLIPLTEDDLAHQGARRLREGLVHHRSVSTEHNNGKKYRLALLACGGTVLLPSTAPLPGLAEACARFGVDCVTLPPQHGEALAAIHARPGASAWPSRTAIVLVGARVGPALRRFVREAVTPALHVAYATTESGGVTQAGPEELGAAEDGVGRPLPGVDLKVVDEAGHDLPAGEVGRIRIRAPGMAPHYLDDAEATGRAFRDGWFEPGDRGRIAADGTLVFAGRDAEMMMLGTINIFPAEIERAAEGFPGLAECAAFPLRSGVLGDIPALAAVETAAGALDPDALLAALRARLGLRAPRRILLLPALPRSAAGKVLRARLEEDAARRA